MLCRLSGRVQAAARGLRGHPGAQRDLAEAQELLREARNARAVSTPTAHTQQRPVGACVPQDRPETLPNLPANKRLIHSHCFIRFQG